MPRPCAGRVETAPEPVQLHVWPRDPSLTSLTSHVAITAPLAATFTGGIPARIPRYAVQRAGGEGFIGLHHGLQGVAPTSSLDSLLL